MAKTPNPNRSYNAFVPQKDDNFERAHKTTYVNAATLAAFDELLLIDSWAEFVAVCDEQKRKRGW